MKYRVSGGSRGERWGEEPSLYINENSEDPGNEYVNKPSKQHTAHTGSLPGLEELCLCPGGRPWDKSVSLPPVTPGLVSISIEGSQDRLGPLTLIAN